MYCVSAANHPNAGRQVRRKLSTPRLAGLTVVLVLVGGLAVRVAGQVPSPPLNVRLLSGPVFPDPEPFSGTTVYVSPSGSDTNSGTQASPVRTIQRGVNLANQVHANGQAARVLVAAGVYRESVDLGTQRTEALFVVEGVGPSTVLTGSDAASSGWTAVGDGTYVRAWPHNWGMKAIPNGWDGYWNWDGKGYQRDALRRSETVYVNGVGLVGKMTRAELSAPGTFHVDEAGDKIYMRLPTGASFPSAAVEIGMRSSVLRVNNRRNVILKNFAALRSRGAVQDNAIYITNGRNIVVDGLTVKQMAYGGLGTAFIDGYQVRNSVFSDNGVTGTGGYRDKNVVMEDTEIARNNWRGWAANHYGWDSVFKWAAYRDAVARRVRIVDNLGNGFWPDYDNQRITLQDSLIAGNRLGGVDLEGNQGPIAILDNRICNNVRGLQDAKSNRVTVQRNKIFGNTEYNVWFTGAASGGRSVTDYLTGQVSVLYGEGWTFTDNLIAGSGSAGWLWHHTGVDWSRVRNTMVLMDRNHWFHSARTTAFRLPQGTLTHAQFKADMQQAKSTNEINSRWEAAPALACQ